jgi:hypothetical protein
MAVMGWSPADAQLEARNFGCSIPDQVDFIQDLGEKLAQGDPGLVGYPRQPLGSHRMTAPERDARYPLNRRNLNSWNSFEPT